MPQPVSADTPLDPAALDPAAREALTARLYDVHRRIFDGVDEAAFRRYVVDSPAERTRIQCFRSADGEIVGYGAFHRFSVALGEQTATILRCEMGMLPAYRGQSIGWQMMAAEVARIMVARPLKPCFLVASPIHPASYYGMARLNPYLLPRPHKAPSPALLTQLDAQLGMVRPAAAGEHVRKVGWITRQTEDEAAWWRSHDSPLVQFFLSENPDYARGLGLRIVCPLHLRSFVAALSTMLFHIARRRIFRRPLIARKAR